MKTPTSKKKSATSTKAAKAAPVKKSSPMRSADGGSSSKGKSGPVGAAKSLSKTKLAYFKNKLLTERRKVLGEMDGIQQANLKQSISDQSGENSRYTYHLGDVASLSYGREFSMGLAERQQKYLEQIDEALQRIEEGTYGICLVTGEPIPEERLEEVPVAKYSVKGKEKLEHQKRQGMGSYSSENVGSGGYDLPTGGDDSDME